jgi:uncharacterized membrane protein YkgB
MGSRVPLQVDLNVTVALILVIASALLGFVTGLFFRVSVLLLLSVLIATISAISLQAYGFGFAGGVSITIGCLVICQITYIASSILMSRAYGGEGLTQHEIDDDPDRNGEHDVRGEDE